MPTTDKRQILINKIKAALALILSASGYYTNLGQKVTEGKVNPFDTNRVDGVDVLDTSDDIEDDTTDEAREIEQHTVTIQISTIAKNSITAETARQHTADVRKAIKTLYSDAWCAENLNDIRNTGNGLEIEQSRDKIIGVVHNFEFDFTTLKLEEA